MEIGDDDELTPDPRAEELLKNNANAWIEIPDYDAHPWGLNLHGFSRPIIPWVTWEYWAPSVTEMIATSRSILRKTIPNISDVYRLAVEFNDTVISDDGTILEDAFPKLTLAQKEAFLYRSFIGRIKAATGGPIFEAPEIYCLQYQFEHLAFASAHLAEWAAGNSEKLLRQHAKNAANRSAEVRRETGKRAQLEQAIRTLMHTKEDRDIPGIIKQRGLASDRYARSVLRDMREKEIRN